MSNDNVDKQNLTQSIPPRPRDSLMPTADGVTIVVTKAFGPGGDNLVGLSDVTFDGYPAVTLKVRSAWIYCFS